MRTPKDHDCLIHSAAGSKNIIQNRIQKIESTVIVRPFALFEEIISCILFIYLNNNLMFLCAKAFLLL